MADEHDALAGATRIADADRERLAAELGRHYVDGRLDATALDERLDAVYRAATLAQADASLAGLPPLAPAPARTRRRLWGRRHGEARRAGPGWRPTTERFRDPSSQRLMRVWIDPGDASRHYVPEDGG